MEKLQLTKGKFTLVDKDDLPFLSQYTWGMHSDGYAHAQVDGSKRLMHRVLMNPPKGMEIDHINGDRLDNRRSNLRICTRAQNGRNVLKTSNKTHSQYKGVTWFDRDKCWKAQIKFDGKHMHVGYYDSESEAARVYNNVSRFLFGEYAKPNMIEAA